jgi:hypothetical protein
MNEFVQKFFLLRLVLMDAYNVSLNAMTLQMSISLLTNASSEKGKDLN